MRRASLFALAALAAATAGAAASDGAGKAVRVETSLHHEVFVPAGAFEMGISEKLRGTMLTACDEHLEVFPQSKEICEIYKLEMQHMEPRQVFVSAFWIDRDEVSVTEYRACVAGGGCEPDPLMAGDERFLVPRWPIVNVTWSEAQDFCRWRGGRLPTEAEWERAARGDTGSEWPWGATERGGDFNHGRPRSEVERTLDRSGAGNVEAYIGNPDDSDGAEYLAPVGTYRWGEGPYGTRDQAGNAAEWTADAWLAPTLPPRVDTGGYDQLDVIDPYRLGSVGDPRVVRGGSWREPAEVARANVRDPFQLLIRPERRYAYIGFRCARPAR